ncbi:MAG: MCE family protein [Legionella sp.]|nr:MCE family protein [Legionella sp.]
MWVGFFVIGALSLLLVGAAFFYQQHQRAQTQTFVMLFKGSLKGLVQSSAVTYRGIKIGEVKLIEVTENPQRTKVKIPAYIQFFVEKKFDLSQDPIHLLIQQGYVAQVGQPNLLSGVSEVELVQSAPPRQLRFEKYKGYPIFPTSAIAQTYTSFDDTMQSAKNALDELNRFIRSEDTQNTLKAIRHMSETITTFVQSKDLQETLAAAKNMSESLQKLSSELREDFPIALNTFHDTFQRLQDAASSIDNLSTYLLRHPEAFIRGRS